MKLKLLPDLSLFGALLLLLARFVNVVDVVVVDVVVDKECIRRLRDRNIMSFVVIKKVWKKINKFNYYETRKSTD